MGAGVDGFGAFNDARAGVFLRRHGAAQEHPGHFNQCMGCLGIISILWGVFGYSLAFTWALTEWITTGKPTIFGTVSGALIIGAVIGVLSYYAVSFIKPKFGYDDTLDAFGVHAVGGFWGTVAIGLLNGNAPLLFTQLKCALFAAAYCALVTWVICWVTNKIVPMRVTQEDEIMGLDLTQHHERAYTILD